VFGDGAGERDAERIGSVWGVALKATEEALEGGFGEGEIGLSGVVADLEAVDGMNYVLSIGGDIEAGDGRNETGDSGGEVGESGPGEGPCVEDFVEKAGEESGLDGCGVMREGVMGIRGSAEHRVNQQGGYAGINLPDGGGGMGVQSEDEEDRVGRETANVLVEGGIIEAFEGDGEWRVEIGGEGTREDLRENSTAIGKFFDLIGGKFGCITEIVQGDGGAGLSTLASFGYGHRAGQYVQFVLGNEWLVSHEFLPCGSR